MTAAQGDRVPEAEGAAAQRDVGAVVNAVRILRCLASATAPVGVTSVARETGISTSTCFSILRTLVRTRLAAFRTSDKTYALGLGMAELAAGLLGMSHAELIRPELERLALNYEALILLWRVTDDNHLVLVDRVHSQMAVRVEINVGYRMPALAGAVGRCVASASRLSTAELRRRFAGLRWQSPPTFDEYMAEVEQARLWGWALDVAGLFRGIISVASVVTDDEGRPRFGLSGVSILGQQSVDHMERL